VDVVTWRLGSKEWRWFKAKWSGLWGKPQLFEQLIHPTLIAVERRWLAGRTSKEGWLKIKCNGTPNETTEHQGEFCGLRVFCCFFAEKKQESSESPFNCKHGMRLSEHSNIKLGKQNINKNETRLCLKQALLFASRTQTFEHFWEHLEEHPCYKRTGLPVLTDLMAASAISVACPVSYAPTGTRIICTATSPLITLQL